MNRYASYSILVTIGIVIIGCVLVGIKSPSESSYGTHTVTSSNETLVCNNQFLGSVSCQSTSSTTHIISTTTSTACVKTITASFPNGQYNGSYSDGTKWISIAGHNYNYTSIKSGALPPLNNNEGQNGWWIISGC